jgi:hypothetical protein
VLASIRPTMAPRESDTDLTLPFLVSAKVKKSLGSIPMVLDTLRKPFAFLHLARLDRKAGEDATSGRSIASSYRYFAWWAFVCLCAFAAISLTTLLYVVWDSLKTYVYPGWYEIVRTGFPWLDVNHWLEYKPNPANIPGRLVALSLGLAGTKYYLDIFATLTTRGIPGISSRAAEFFMRFNSFWFGIGVVFGNLFLVQHWLLVCAVAVMPIVANNYFCYRLANREVMTGEREFSTIADSGLKRKIDEYASWWQMMLGYTLMLATVGWLTETHIITQTWPFAVLAICLNMIKLYASNCGRLAPGLRASLTRAFVTGQRLEALRKRRILGA